MKKGISANEYLDILGQDNKTDWEELLKIAMETRKFEIELYWKRASYFWLFVAAFFAAYYGTLPNVSQTSGYRIENILLTIGGYALSLSWFYANRGSKYWQENWEKHITVLSEHLKMPIFDLLKSNKSPLWNILASYPYSVSRINQVLNIIIVITWGILLVTRAYFITEDSGWRAFYMLASGGIMIAIAIIIHFSSRSFVVREPADHSKDFFDNRASR